MTTLQKRDCLPATAAAAPTSRAVSAARLGLSNLLRGELEIIVVIMAGVRGRGRTDEFGASNGGVPNTDFLLQLT